MSAPLPYRGADIDVARSVDITDRKLRNSIAALDWRDRAERHVALLRRIADAGGHDDLIRRHGHRLLAMYEDVRRHPPKAERDYWRAAEAWVRENPNHPVRAA